MSADARVLSDHDEDGALARAHLDGDPEAFAILYRRYYPDLVRYVARRGADHARAEDVAQETLARAYRYFRGFDPSRPVWPWLRTIATRIAAVEAGRCSNEVLVDDPAADTAHPGGDPLDAIAGRVTLAQAMRQLPLRQRDALLLRYVEDQQPSDIAASFGLTRTAFEQLLWRARRSLAREYAKVTTALAPLALRLRRAVAWCDARVQLIVATAGGMLPDTVVAATVATAAAVVAIVSSPMTPAASASAGPMTPPHTNRPSSVDVAPVPSTVPATGAGDGDVTVAVSRSVEGAGVTTHATVAKHPTRPGERSEKDDTVISLPLVGPVIRVSGEHNNGSSPVLCRNVPGVCHIATQ